MSLKYPPPKNQPAEPYRPTMPPAHFPRFPTLILPWFTTEVWRLGCQLRHPPMSEAWKPRPISEAVNYICHFGREFFS
jgi:hypothetical protein